MRSAGFKKEWGFFVGVVLLNLFSFQALAAEEPRTDQSLTQFESLKARLTALETQQQETLKEKTEILEKLNTLRIQMRHSPGTPQP